MSSRAHYEIAHIRHAIKEPIGRKAINHIHLHAPHWLPRITRQRGQRTERLFWQSGGGYDRNITTAKTLLSMIEFLHLNPVRRKLVEKAVQWKWSSAAGNELGQSTPLLLDPIPPAWLNMDGA